MPLVCGLLTLVRVCYLENMTLNGGQEEFPRSSGYRLHEGGRI